jgi:putative FmdB family regulatory protein
MPIYEFKCKEHGVSEHILKHSQLEQVEVVCMDCGRIMDRMLSNIAKTATLWDGGWKSGLQGSGFHSASVGRHVSSKREEEKIMRAKGYIRESELGGDTFYEKMTTKNREERQRLDNMANSYIDNLKKFEGDKMKAVVETFPAHEMLAQSEAT